MNFGIDDDAFHPRQRPRSPDFLADQLTLTRAYVTNPGFREESLTEFRRALDSIYQQLHPHTGRICPGCGRRISPFGRHPIRITKAVEALTIDQAKEWLLPDLASGYCELTLVGDFDKTAVIELLAKTFGNLPERAVKKPDYTAERIVKFPAVVPVNFFSIQSFPKAWPLSNGRPWTSFKSKKPVGSECSPPFSMIDSG